MIKEVVMKLRDFKGMFKTEKLKFISAENVFGDYYVVRMKVGKNTTWRPGEHAIFTLPKSKVHGRKWRVFSVSSTREENMIQIGTRTGKNISGFKNTLFNLTKDSTVKMRGPFGWFVEQEKTSPMVLIAGGVGITPVRALLLSMKDVEKKIHLIYSSPELFLFKDEIDAITQGNKSIIVSYVNTLEETRAEIAKTSKKYGNKAFYYISGSPSMIKGVKKDIKKLGIKGKRIINDPFFGY